MFMKQITILTIGVVTALLVTGIANSYARDVGPPEIKMASETILEDVVSLYAEPHESLLIRFEAVPAAETVVAEDAKAQAVTPVFASKECMPLGKFDSRAFADRHRRSYGGSNSITYLIESKLLHTRHLFNASSGGNPYHWV